MNVELITVEERLCPFTKIDKAYLYQQQHVPLHAQPQTQLIDLGRQ